MRYATKNVFALLFWIAIIAVVVGVFVCAVLPRLTTDIDQFVENELESHNVKLEAITQDFTSVISLEDVYATIEDGQIRIKISGEFCDLEATLNSDMRLISLNHKDKSEDKLVGPIFAGIGLGLVAVAAIVFICLNIKEIASVIIDNRRFKLSRKKQSDVDVTV